MPAKKTKPATDSIDILKDKIVFGLLEKKAENVTVINLKNAHNAITDYFVIASGTSDTHIDAISYSVEEEVIKALNLHPTHSEGKSVREWILLDYLDVVVHVFSKEKRSFYNLEALWGDAEVTHIKS